jgi:hypothetical protein
VFRNRVTGIGLDDSSHNNFGSSFIMAQIGDKCSRLITDNYGVLPKTTYFPGFEFSKRNAVQ